jgi:hypothetical protein
MSHFEETIKTVLKKCGYELDKEPPRIKFENGVLLCPKCGGNYLHHGRTTVFDRREDAERTNLTEVEGGMIFHAVVPSEIAGNPSSRRGGIAIIFSCELCAIQVELTIAQHKGQTLCSWRDCPDIKKAYSQFSKPNSPLTRGSEIGNPTQREE